MKWQFWFITNDELTWEIWGCFVPLLWCLRSRRSTPLLQYHWTPHGSPPGKTTCLLGPHSTPDLAAHKHQVADISPPHLGRSNSSWKQELGMIGMTYNSNPAQIMMKLVSEIPHFYHHVLQGSGLLVLAEADVEVARWLCLLHQDWHQFSLLPAIGRLQLLAAHRVWRNRRDMTHHQLWEKIPHLRQTATHALCVMSHYILLMFIIIMLHCISLNIHNTYTYVFHTSYIHTYNFSVMWLIMINQFARSNS